MRLREEARGAVPGVEERTDVELLELVVSSGRTKQPIRGTLRSTLLREAGEPRAVACG
jgi:hypothetical protein